MSSRPLSPAERTRLVALLRAMDRRAFLRASAAAGVALAAPSVLPGCRTVPPPEPRSSGLVYLAPAEAYVLDRFAARILPAHPPRPTVEALALVKRLDAEIGWLQAHIDPQLGRDFRRLLTLAEYGPFVIGFHFRPFTRLSVGAQDAYLRAWERHRFGTLRMAFRVLRDLCAFFYFCDERTWESIRYAGPWVSGGQAKVTAWQAGGPR